MNTFETNMRDGTNAASSDAPKNKVYYIADVEGTIASYNPNYILRKLPGEDPYKMALPSAAGTLALTSDIEAVSGEIYEEINEIKNNYNELRTDTDEISGKVDALEDIVSGTDVAHLGETETFTGNKTFSNPILVGGDDAGLSVTYVGFVKNVDGAEYTYDLPLKSGQLALDSDLSAYRTASAQDSIDAAQDAAIAAKYTKPSGGIPAGDLAAGVIPTAPVQSVNGKTGAVVLAASDVGAATKEDATLTDVSVPTDWVFAGGLLEAARENLPAVPLPNHLEIYHPANVDVLALVEDGEPPTEDGEFGDAIVSGNVAALSDAMDWVYSIVPKGGTVATRSTVPGYQLGSQTGKPLALAGNYALKSELPDVPVKTVKRNGTALVPDAQGAVNVEVPTLPLSVESGGTGAATAAAARANLGAMAATADGNTITTGGTAWDGAPIGIFADQVTRAVTTRAPLYTLAAEYSEGGSYAAGDVVFYTDNIYACTASTPSPAGEFDFNLWAIVNVASLLDERQPTIPDLATIRSGAAAGATAVQPAQRNLLDYTTGTTLAPQTAVYGSSLNEDGTFPAISDTAIPTVSAYYLFELELTVPSTVPPAIVGPTGWDWIDGHGLPDPADLSGGERIYISVRFDCMVRTFLASVWRVA